MQVVKLVYDKSLHALSVLVFMQSLARAQLDSTKLLSAPSIFNGEHDQ